MNTPEMNFFASTVFVLILIQHVSGFPLPDYESDWLFLESQSVSTSSRVVDHGLGAVPIKVKVLVKPLAGPYEGWMFEAVTCQQVDDDVPWDYFGVVYFYDDKNVYLSAPKKNNDYDTGIAFSLDCRSWSSGPNMMDQVEAEVLAKVLAWNSSSFPFPDFDSGWKYVALEEISNVTDVPHGLGVEPTLVQLQIRNPITMAYAEGCGAGSTTPPGFPYVTMRGLLFAYNNSHVRVWSPNDLKSAAIGGLSDGYENLGGSYKSGEFRVRCWKSLGYEPQQFSFALNERNDFVIPDMSALKVNLRQWDPQKDYISVQVRALDGPNKNFVFGAIGQGQRNAFPSCTYGGVRFGYSKENIAIFVPANKSGSIIHVPETWGPPEYNQISNNVEITVKLWNTTFDGTCRRERSSKWTSQIHKFDGSCRYWVKCSSSCLSEPSCIGFIPSPTSNQCQLMDLSMANNRTLEGVLGNEREVLLKDVVCN